MTTRASLGMRFVVIRLYVYEALWQGGDTAIVTLLMHT